ncbi:hypothetical protein V6N12_005814 [Hibiscus sabdariffa]|uniref:Uncharacterized protein n=1 Tax=Hibiscus sabdariffa TaxID=183260 RepID=A0ABR2AW46_9ROSI
MEEACPILIAQVSCSPLWSAIAQSWNLLHENLVWLPENDESICFWDDVCIPTLGPLLNWVPLQPYILDTNGFHNFLHNDDQRDVSKLHFILPSTAIPYIVCIPPPNQVVRDVCAWKWGITNSLSVSSVYAKLVDT